MLSTLRLMLWDSELWEFHCEPVRALGKRKHAFSCMCCRRVLVLSAAGSGACETVQFGAFAVETMWLMDLFRDP